MTADREPQTEAGRALYALYSGGPALTSYILAIEAEARADAARDAQPDPRVERLEAEKRLLMDRLAALTQDRRRLVPATWAADWQDPAMDVYNAPYIDSTTLPPAQGRRHTVLATPDAAPAPPPAGPLPHLPDGMHSGGCICQRDALTAPHPIYNELALDDINQPAPPPAGIDVERVAAVIEAAERDRTLLTTIYEYPDGEWDGRGFALTPLGFARWLAARLAPQPTADPE